MRGKFPQPVSLVNALKLHEGALRSPTGNFHHVLYLAEELVKLDEFDVRLLVDLDSYQPFAERVGEQNLITTALRGNSILAADYAVWRAVRKLRPAIYHRPTGQIPFFPLSCRTVGGVADLNFISLPCALPKRLYKEASYRWTIRHADRVVCVSNFTRQDVISRLRCPVEKLRVVYHGANQLPAPDWAVHDRIPGSYWIAFAHQQHKNAELCLQALADHRRINVASALVLIGENSYIEKKLKPLAQTLGVGKAVYFPGRVTAAELSGLYHKALGLLFPTRFEGFGLPVLEAMQVGCPVICSNVCSLPEVAGDAAILVSPNDLSGMEVAMQKIITSLSFRESLIKAGFAQAARFSWVKAAKETADIYREILKI